MKFPLFLALSLAVAACSLPPLPDPSLSGPVDPEAPTPATSYRPVMAGTAAYVPVELKPWRELNDDVAPRSGRSP